MQKQIVKPFPTDVGCTQAVENRKDSGQREAEAEGERVILYQHTADVEHNDGDDDGIEHTDNRNGKMDNVFQTEVGHNKAEQRDEGYEALVLHLVMRELSKIAGDRGREADSRREAGADDDEREHELAGKPHVMRRNHAEQRRTVGHNAKNIRADCACVGESAVDERQEEGGDEACIGAQPGECLRVLDALRFDGLNRDGAKENSGQKVHRVIALLEAAEER